jgi:phenylalanyl-tRNA synthetase beta chain
MKFSLNWLNRYTELPMEDKEKLNVIIDRIALQIVDVDERWMQEKDAIIDVDNKIITNRPYCFGHRGLAREIAVMLDQEWKGGEYPEIPNVPVGTGRDLSVQVRVEDPDLCPRFTALVIKNVKIGPSPEFLKYAVESVGLRSINNIVDITNMIMLDTGQPVHAYDYHKIKDATIIVRRAKQGEKVVTLDGVERTLDNSMLLITDAEKVIGIGGVMGAGNSEIDDDTTDIILEVASFHPKNIRQTARVLRHRTDAVTRFEKGPDPSNIPNVMAFMAELVVHVGGGEVASSFVDIANLEVSTVKWQSSTMDFNPKRVDTLLGFGIKEELTERVLRGFGIGIQKIETGNWKVEIPSYRPDLKEPADLIEDIGRMYGYQNIPVVTPVNQLVAPAINNKVSVLRRIRKALTSSGLDEAVTFSFLSQRDIDIFSLTNSIPVINPFSEEYKYLRPSLIPSLIKTVTENVKYFDDFGLFEIARKFDTKTSDKKSYEEDHGESLQPDEIELVSMVYYSKEEKERSIFKLKGALLNLLDELRITNYKLLFNGEILLNGKEIGKIGLLNDKILKNYDIDYPVSYLEIELQPLLAEFKDTKAFKPYSKFQDTQLDYSVLVPLDLPVDEVFNRVPEHELIVNKEVFDVYRDSARLGDRKSISIRITLQKLEGNLTDQEIYAVGQSVEKGLKQVKDLEIRGNGMGKTPSLNEEQSEKNKEQREESKEQNVIDLSRIVVGKILDIQKHPNADRLVIVKVDVGDSKPEDTLESNSIQIVTGAPNIVESKPVGTYVPVALPGAVVKSHKDGSIITIKPSKLRGEVSEGMLCSKDELGLEDDIGGIWILDSEKYEKKIGVVFEF